MYISANGLNWLADQIATQDFHVSLHTASPGNDGTANEATGGNYTRRTVSAASLTVTGAESRADNAADIVLFTPNAGAANITVSHIGYWRDPTGDNEFFGWVPLATSFTTADGVPVTISTGTMAFNFQLATG